MPLTPTDVANKQFRIAFRGYSLDEVDAFLDEVETELTRLLRDNAALRERPAAPAAPAAAAPVPAAAEPAAAPPAAPAAVGGMEGQEAALRTLLLAQRTADEAIAEARAEAEQIVTAARAEAESTLTSARSEAESTLTSARSEAESTLTSARSEAESTLTTAQQRAARLDQEVAARIQAATGDLDVRRRELEHRIEELRAFEREYRTRLKAYLESQLRDLDSGAVPDDGGAGVPAGARSAAVTGSTGGRAPAPGPGATPGSPATPAPAPAAAPAPVPGPGGPGFVPARGAAPAALPAEAAQEAPDAPPREAEAPSTLRAVPPLAREGAPVGPFTVVRPSDGDDGAADR